MTGQKDSTHSSSKGSYEKVKGGRGNENDQICKQSEYLIDIRSLLLWDRKIVLIHEELLRMRKSKKITI